MSKSRREGVVIRQYQGHYIVARENNVVDCALSSRLRKQLQYPEADPGSRRRRVQNVRRVRVIDPVTVGDRVVFEDGGDHTGMIREILPRRNKISRRAAGQSKKEQLLGANIDQVMPVFSAAEPELEWHLLDRMLAVAEWQNVPAVICFNKIDLVSESFAREAMHPYEKIGYHILYTSVASNLGKDAFRSALQTGTTLFMGPSGVGKSSLLNRLQPGLQLRTGDISEATGEGRHTTTHTELVSLESGGLVGDVPGVREFHLWDIAPEDTPHLFREFYPYLGNCRFRDCSHTREPGCAVKTAVETGDIPPSRYESYLLLHENP